MAALKNKRDEKLYRLYVTDALKAITENTSRHLGMNGIVEAGSTLKMRFADIIPDKKPKEKEKEKTADEVISNLKNKLKRLGKGGH